MRVLVVREPFGDYAVGAMIRDADAMKAILEGGQAAHVIPTDVDDAFFAEPAPAKGKPAAAAS